MGTGKLDHRIQFRRATKDDDGFSEVDVWMNHGNSVWASKEDVGDGERLRAGEISATLTAQFVVRSSTFTRALTAKDTLIYNGVTYAIFGIKPIGRKQRLEITAGAEVSNGNG